MPVAALVSVPVVEAVSVEAVSVDAVSVEAASVSVPTSLCLSVLLSLPYSNPGPPRPVPDGSPHCRMWKFDSSVSRWHGLSS